MMCLVFGHRLGFVKKVGVGTETIYKIWVNGETFWVARKERIFRYIYGVTPRLKKIYRTYGMHSVALPKDVSVVDIGCNDGTFMANFLESSGKIIGIDLELNEIVCAAANVPNSDVLRAGLWFEFGLGNFESAPKYSDSSLIHHGEGDRKLIPLITIDQILSVILESHEDLDILKVEAEGAEPEVLSGASKSLRRIKYVAVAGGPERGPRNRNTSHSIKSLLSNQNFKNIYCSPDGTYMLFKNVLLE